MKFFIGSLLLLQLLYGQTSKLIIDAKQFVSNDKDGISVFEGDVKLQRDKDILKSDKLEVFMQDKTKTNKRVASKYEATGHVSFNILTNEKHYIGKGDKIIFNPVDEMYIILGNGTLKETNEDRTLIGDEIFINIKTGEARIKGTKEKPVRLIINIETQSSDSNDIVKEDSTEQVDEKEENINQEDKKEERK